MSQSFPRYFNENTSKLKIINKDKSVFMKIIAGLLWLTKKMRFHTIDDFMTRYVTTIGCRIYGPTERGSWNMDMEPTSTLYHEMGHVLESKLEPVLYELKYLLSKKWRARYESICVQVEMAMFKERRTIKYADQRAPHFVPYGIPLETMRKELHDRVNELKAGNPHAATTMIVQSEGAWRAQLVQDRRRSE